MKYDIFKPWLTLDPWQKEYIAEEGNCVILCGRQSGKTAAMSIKFGDRAANNSNKIILMIALTEKQAYALFFKTLMYLEARYPKMIKRGLDKPTKHIIKLKNNSIIMCYAAGLTGEGIRTYTVTDLVVDEAAPMAREVFISVTPMLSVTGGTIDLSSTPRGKEGYFYECTERKDFRTFYVSAEDCPRHEKEFLEAEKERMSKLEYAQEYLALFLDELKRVFSDDLIKQSCVLKRRDGLHKDRTYYLGVDVAGFGKDECTYEILDKITKESVEQVESIIEKRNLTTDTSNKIIALERSYNFKSIGVDDGGVGFGVFSELLRAEETRRKTIALNNASRDLNRDGTKSKKLLKVDMYMNLVAMMEHKRIKLLEDDELIDSLKSIQYEYLIRPSQKSELRIFGSYSHIVEGLIRAAWLCEKDKSLNIFFEWI